MEEDPPEEPPKKGYFYGRRKRGRSLSRHQSSKNNQKSSFRPSSRSSGETVQPRPTATSRERDRDREQGQKRKITKKELLSALKKTQKEVEEKQLLLAASQKKCSQLSTKNSSLVVGIRDARSQARSSKAATARAEEEARATSIQFDRSTLELQSEVFALQSTLAAKEVEHKKAVDAAVEKEVANVKEKAQGLLARHVASVEKKAASKFSAAMSAKNKTIQQMSTVVSGNRDAASEAQLQLAILQRQHKEAMAALDVEHRAAMMALKKAHASVVAQKNAKIKELQDELVETEALAGDVAKEYGTLESTIAEAAKCNAAKEDRLVRSAAQRLEKVKQSKALLQQQKYDFAEEQQATHEYTIELMEEVDALKQQIEVLGSELIDAYHTIEELTPPTIEKKGHPKTWDARLTQLIVEMLAHRTPPACIGPNILSTIQILFNDAIKINEMPSIRFIRSCRTVLVYVTQTLAAFRLARAKRIIQTYFDGTSRRQTHMQNFTAKLADDDNQYCTLDASILARDESSDAIGHALVQVFHRGRDQLDFWREVTAEMYPNRSDLLQQIPPSKELSLTKARESFRTSDTCNGAVKLQGILTDMMKQLAAEEGLSDLEVLHKMALCWQHLRNVWLNGANIAACEYVNEILAEDIKNLPSIYRINIDSVDLFRCIEKEFGETANYAKGHSKQFFQMMKNDHPGAYLYPICRALGGSRQDLSVEGAPGVLMNLPYYLQFLNWRSAAVGGKSDGVLATKLYIMLRSVEVVALLRVLSILHLAVCLPTRWLAGKSHELADFDFGYYDMGKVLNCMETAFEAILEDPTLFLDEDFMLNQMFKDISDTVDPFAEYISHMYEQKVTLTVSGVNNDDLFYDDLRAALFYPSRKDIMQTESLSTGLAVIIASAFLKEFRDEKKPTHHYLSSAGGMYSVENISEEQRQSAFGIEASNSIAESVHASATHSLKLYGTVRLDSAAAEGQTRSNNDFGRCYDTFVNPCRKNKSDTKTKPIGAMISLPIELQISLMAAGKRYAPRLRKAYDEALETQHQDTLERQKLAVEKECEKKGEEYIEGWDYLQRWHSDRCWKTKERALEVYNSLTSESAKLKAVKEQILIRRKGTIGEEAGHKWSQNGYYFSSKELLNHFISVILPMEKDREVPKEPPVQFHGGVSEQHKLGTMTQLEYINNNQGGMTIEQIKANAIKERERREREGETDRDAHLQSNIQPAFDESLIGFKIEYCFSYDEEDGTPYLSWCDGEVVAIVNEKSRMVMIKWNKDKVAAGDALESKHKLLVSRWNPKTARMGAWRAFVGE